MQFTTTALALATMATAAIAAPTAAGAKSMMAADTAEWTIEGFTRTCNADDSSCDYSFTVDTHTVRAPLTACSYSVAAQNGAPASQSPGNGATCGPFTVTSGWSGQFGPGNGFTTLAVTDQQQIVYPSYTDAQLVNGQAVTPDQSYAPQSLP